MPNNSPQQNTPQQQISRAAESATKTAERLESEAERAASVALDKVRQAREDAQSGIEQQRDQIAHRVRRVSDVLRSNGQLLGNEDPLVQQLFETAGDGIERVASYIDNITPSDVMNDLQTLARRSPGLFFGGSFLVGLALGRFAKSTGGAMARAREDEEYEQLTARRAPERRAPERRTPERPQAASTGGLPRGVGSSVSATTGTGSAHNPSTNAPPSYGGASSAAHTASEESASNVSSRARAVEPGEGSKS